MHACVYVCLFAWLACQDIWLHPSPMEDYRKWQIKGLSLAEDWEIQQEQEVWVDVYVRASEYVRTCLSACVSPSRRRMIPLATKPISSVIPPKTVPCLMLATDSAAASTVQLGRWQCPFGVVWRRQNKGRERKRESQQRGQADRAERGNRSERVREAGYPLLQDLMAKNRILIDLCVVMHWDRYAQVHTHCWQLFFCTISQQRKEVVSI